MTNEIMSSKNTNFFEHIQENELLKNQSPPGKPTPFITYPSPPSPANSQINEPFYPSPKNSSTSNRHDRMYLIVLGKKIIDLDKIRNIAWSGIPIQFRPRVWRLFLDYEPINNEVCSSVLTHKRNDYLDCLDRLFSEDHKLLWTTAQRGIIHQIELDLPRTGLQTMKDQRVHDLFLHVLFIWAIRHPASGYVQGMNDILLPFYIAFLQPFYPNLSYEEVFNLNNISSLSDNDFHSIEADCFWCFGKLLDGLQDVFTKDRDGLFRMLSDFSNLEEKVHPELHKILQNEGINYQDFAIPWMNCLLVRQFKISLLMRIWDLYLAQHQKVSRTVVYLCSAIMDTIQPQLEAIDPSDYRTKLQHLNGDFWSLESLEMVLAQEYILENKFSFENLRLS